MQSIQVISEVLSVFFATLVFAFVVMTEYKMKTQNVWVVPFKRFRVYIVLFYISVAIHLVSHVLVDSL